MRIRRGHVVIATLVVAVAVIVAVLMRPSVLDVEVGTVERGIMRVTIDDDAVTRMRHHVEVAAPVSGRMAESEARAGDSVKAGAVVARLYPAPLDARAREAAIAAHAAARSLHEEARARVEQARVALDEARRARIRAARLADAGATAASELERVVSEETLRQRDLDAAMARADAAAQDERRARTALVGSDPATTSRSPVALRAPFGGVVLRVFEEHDRVVPAGTTLLEIGDPASLEIVADVLTRDAVAIRQGTPMLVRVANQEPVLARVVRVEPAAFTKLSPLGVEEQRVNVVGAFDERPAALGDRFEVDVSIVIWEKENALKVPVGALVRQEEGWRVYVVADNTVRLRAVEIGQRNASEAEVLTGLDVGERVVLHPDERLGEGSRIRVTATR